MALIRDPICYCFSKGFRGQARELQRWDVWRFQFLTSRVSGQGFFGFSESIGFMVRG